MKVFKIDVSSAKGYISSKALRIRRAFTDTVIKDTFDTNKVVIEPFRNRFRLKKNRIRYNIEYFPGTTAKKSVITLDYENTPIRTERFNENNESIYLEKFNKKTNIIYERINKDDGGVLIRRYVGKKEYANLIYSFSKTADGVVEEVRVNPKTGQRLIENGKRIIDSRGFETTEPKVTKFQVINPDGKSLTLERNEAGEWMQTNFNGESTNVEKVEFGLVKNIIQKAREAVRYGSNLILRWKLK